MLSSISRGKTWGAIVSLFNRITNFVPLGEISFSIYSIKPFKAVATAAYKGEEGAYFLLPFLPYVLRVEGDFSSPGICKI